MVTDDRHRTMDELVATAEHLWGSPTDDGPLELIVRRPAAKEREVLDEAHLDLVDGLVGDNWRTRGSRRTPDGSSDPDKQLTIMNARAIAVIAGDRSRWPLAGDQLYVDLRLTRENLPAGCRLRLGTAVIEITDSPHRGCAKFQARFGTDAMRFVNVVPEVRDLRLRGVHARVIEPGVVRRGDRAVKA